MSGMHIQLTTSYRYRILICILLLTDSYLMFLLSFNKFSLSIADLDIKNKTNRRPKKNMEKTQNVLGDFT